MVGFDWSLLQRGIADTLNGMRNIESQRYRASGCS
jgi:hypothetical protein